MKQLSLALFLIFISISSISSKLFKTKTRVKSELDPMISGLSRQGNMTVEDIGCSNRANWVCAKNGTILKSSATAVSYILSGTIEGKCASIDVDYNGLPWVINDKGDVYRLQQIVADSVVFQKVYTADDKNPKALDVACGQFEGTPCYIIVQDGTNPLVFTGTFEKDGELDAKSKMKRISVISGKTGIEVVTVNEDDYILHLTRNNAPISLGMKGSDLSVSYGNDLYVINGYGVYYKSKCSKFFVLLHDINARRICASTSLWVTGLDNYVYNGTLHTDVDGC